MRTKFTLEMPMPCSENWNHMLVEEQGRFCQNCQTTVIDFSGMTETEIKNFFQKSTGKVCGRVQPHQLKEYMLPAKPRFSFTFFSILGLAALFAPVVGLSKSKPVSIEQVAVTDILKTEDKQNQFAPGSGNYLITGKIFDKDDPTQGLPGVTVYLKGTQTATATQADGSFTLQANETSSDKITLVISFIGFKTLEKEVLLSGPNKMDLGNITINLDANALGEVVLVGGIANKWYAPRNIWYQFKQVFH